MEGPRDFHLNLDGCVIKKTSEVAFKMEEGGTLDIQRTRYLNRTNPRVGRNARCSCGSGSKFKHCHGS
jgi:uncharacterized protein YchJ